MLNGSFLVLRSFFATRKVGGFLVALAIGLFIFYPVFIMVFPTPNNDLNQSITNMQMVNNNSYYAAVPIVDLNNNYAIAGKIDLMSGRCNSILAAYNATFNLTGNFTGNGTNVTTNSSNTTLSNCINVTQALNLTANTSTDFTSDITVAVEGNTNSLSKSLLYAVVAPIFSLLVTIIFVRELASLLGSEIGLRTIASI